MRAWFHRDETRPSKSPPRAPALLRSSLPSATFQYLISLSSPPVASRSPLGLNATAVRDFLRDDQRADLRPLGDIPEPRRLVGGGRGRELAVGAQGHAVNLRRYGRESVFGPAGGSSPERDTLVAGAGEQRRRVGREGHRSHRRVRRLIARQLGLLGVR